MIRSLSWTFFIIGSIGLLSFDTFAISPEDDEKDRPNSPPYASSGKPTEDSFAPEDLERTFDSTTLYTLRSFLERLPLENRPYYISRLVPIIRQGKEDGNYLTQISSGAFPNGRNLHFQLLFNKE